MNRLPKKKNKSAREVFKTSTLQQLASTKLNFAPSKTMKIAQQLYEGIDLGNETVGLITYMRTDSVRISDSFVAETYNYIKGNYGDEYIGYVKKGKKMMRCKMLMKVLDQQVSCVLQNQ